MGMLVDGLNPNAPAGEDFRRCVWCWHPLWDYCSSVSSLARQVRYGHSNDHDGLDGRRARSLAKALQRELDSGLTSQYIAEREEELSELPDEPCWGCTDTKNRPRYAEGAVFMALSRAPNNGAANTQCDVCKGTGKVRPWATHYHFDEGDVREFAEFLKHCGGFVIA